MPVDISRYDSYVVLTLDQPDKLNALSSSMMDDLRDVFSQIEGDTDLRCVILTGAGVRAFSAGTNIKELAKLSESEALAVSLRGQALCNQIEHCNVPVIAAVNGIAAGGGCELALACHLRVASRNASFSLPETKLAVIPGYGGTQRLAREIGSGRALDMMLTGRTLTAEEALESGLLNRLTTGDALTEAVSLANEIAGLAPLAIQACLKAVIVGADLPLEEGLALEAKLFADLFATEDMREGTRAFLEKRPPVFSGK